MSAASAETVIRFEGLTDGTDVWAATTANFLIQRPGHHAKEASVMLTDAGAAYLAALLSVQDTPEFRKQSAEHVGLLWMQRVVEQGRPIESIVQLARNVLEREPAFLDRVRALTAQPAPAAEHPDGEPAHAAHDA
ncbi:MAG: hypothetical protein ACKVVT_04950 [Dehalococcoidia bacterium]